MGSQFSIIKYGHLSAELYSGEGRDEILALYLREWEGISGPVLAAMCGKMELWKDGQISEREESDYRERLYTRPEFHSLLTEAGFRNIQVKRAYDGGQPGAIDDLVFLAFKPGS